MGTIDLHWLLEGWPDPHFRATQEGVEPSRTVTAASSSGEGQEQDNEVVQLERQEIAEALMAGLRQAFTPKVVACTLASTDPNAPTGAEYVVWFKLPRGIPKNLAADVFSAALESILVRWQPAVQVYRVTCEDYREETSGGHGYGGYESELLHSKQAWGPEIKAYISLPSEERLRTFLERG